MSLESMSPTTLPMPGGVAASSVEGAGATAVVVVAVGAVAGEVSALMSYALILGIFLLSSYTYGGVSKIPSPHTRKRCPEGIKPRAGLRVNSPPAAGWLSRSYPTQ